MDGEAQTLLATLLSRVTANGGWPADAYCRTGELAVVARRLNELLKPRLASASARKLASIAE